MNSHSKGSTLSCLALLLLVALFPIVSAQRTSLQDLLNLKREESPPANNLSPSTSIPVPEPQPTGSLGESRVNPCGNQLYCGGSEPFDSKDQLKTFLENSPGGLAGVVEGNRQEEEIQEADILKTDGNYVFTLSKGILSVSRVFPIESAGVIFSQSLSLNRPQNLFLTTRYLAIFGTQFGPDFHSYALVYDHSNKSNIRQVQHFKVEGRYVDARMNEKGQVYMITKQDPVDREEIAPRYDLGLGWNHIRIQSIFIFNGQEYRQPKFANLFCFNLNTPDEFRTANMVAILIDNVHQFYLTPTSLYLTVLRSNQSMQNADENHIFKVFLENNIMIPFATASVRGSVKDQFVMDEVGDNFRILTYVFKPVANSPRGYHIHSLDFSLASLNSAFYPENGDVDSARFTNNRLYFSTSEFSNGFHIVTFENQMPVYQAKIQTGIKLTYLNAFSPNTVIGLGKSQQTYGLSVSVIDVSNPSFPSVRDEFLLEDQYSSSIAEFEHKAFLSSAQLNIMVIPAKNDRSPKFNGVFAFSLTDSQFSLEILIDHLLNPRDNFEGRSVERSFIIDSILYTKSPCLIRAHSMIGNPTFQPLANIQIPCSNSDLGRRLNVSFEESVIQNSQRPALSSSRRPSQPQSSSDRFREQFGGIISIQAGGLSP